MRYSTGLLTIALLLLPIVSAANIVTFDYLATGTTFGAPVGDAPGDYIFSEDLADVYVDNFWVGGSPYFNLAQVVPCYSYFGYLNILNLNNLSLVIDFTAPGDVVFEFMYLGGDVCLQVNGSGVILEGPNMASLAGVVAPGVTLTVSGLTTVPGGHKGIATLTGPVTKLLVGGQEFFIDGLDCNNGISSTPADCDYAVTHASLLPGAHYGPSTGYAPGDYLFAEDGIGVFIEEFDWGSGTGFNYCEVIIPGIPNFGDGNAMWTNNVCNRYDIGGLGIPVQEVTFEYVDQGGMENLKVNGATLHIGEMTSFPNNIAPGVIYTVNTYTVPGGVRGEVTLTGHVHELWVGGQEFIIDELCVIEGEDPNADCNYLVDHESQGLGTIYGPSAGHVPGEVIFFEDNIPVILHEFDYGSGVAFNLCRIEPTFNGMGDSHAMMFNNISNIYEFDVLGIPIGAVTFEFMSYGGEENIMVNGFNLYIGNIENAPANIAPGVTYSVTTYALPGGGVRGEARLTGEVMSLLLGGQEFFADNICVIEETALSAPSASRTIFGLEPNYPNPFNPTTTLMFTLGHEDHVRLAIHDIAGHLVTTLIDETRTAGVHRVAWNGRNSSGVVSPAGLYFVRLVGSNGQVSSQKIALIK